MELIKALTVNYYWAGVLVSLFCLYFTAWIYKACLQNRYTLKKDSSAIFLILFFCFFSWYAPVILIAIFIIAAIIWFIQWLLASIFNSNRDVDDM